MKRGYVILGDALQFLKAHIELIGQGVFCILFDGQAAAMIRAFVGKGPDDGIAVCMDALSGYR